MHVCSADSVTSTLCDSLRPYGLEPTRLLCPWDSPGKDTGVGGHALLQAIFQTQGLNLGPPVSPALQADSFHCWVTTEAPIRSKNLFWKWKLAGPIFKLQLEAVIPRRPEKEKKREQEWGREAWAEAPNPTCSPGPWAERGTGHLLLSGLLPSGPHDTQSLRPVVSPSQKGGKCNLKLVLSRRRWAHMLISQEEETCKAKCSNSPVSKWPNWI